MSIYFVRHGQSEANVLRVMSNRGWRHGLTEDGRRQVAALAARLGSTPVSRLLTSPLRRAVETARILGTSLGVPFETTGALREFDCGVLEATGDEAGWQTHAEVVDDWLRRGRLDSRIEGGESFLDLKQRFLPLVDEVVGAGGGGQGDTLLVGHGGLYRCMLPLVLSNVDHGFALAHSITYAGCVVAEVQNSAFLCVDWNGQPVPPLPLP